LFAQAVVHVFRERRQREAEDAALPDLDFGFDRHAGNGTLV
jgi:hypothetical protein